MSDKLYETNRSALSLDKREMWYSATSKRQATMDKVKMFIIFKLMEYMDLETLGIFQAKVDMDCEDVVIW